MKAIRLILLMWFLSFNSFAQSTTPKMIEADLLKAYKRIEYWNRGSDAVGDSLAAANELFEKKLKYYAIKYPFTISQKFQTLLPKIYISSSEDGLFRIYSWDTWEGGTMHDFNSLFQYKVGDKVMLFNIERKEGEPSYYYPNIYTLKANRKTYYLATYSGVYSTKDCGNGIQIFGIENGKLKNDIQLIKTQSGMHNKLYYDYNFASVVDWKVRPSIQFDNNANIIKLPVVDHKGSVTHKNITYKFTGKYFEKVK